ncbi:hypothetical protein MKW92_013616 [Papaver armeniacum]|nr:hypothetical protein MKW92_013616 [Papaver armeniacum]
MEILVPPYNFLLLSLFLLPLYFFITYKTRKIDDPNKPNLPPGPPKLPIIGNLHQLEQPYHRALSQLSKIYGPVMLLRLGIVPTLVVSSAETSEQVLKTFDLDFCTRPSLVGLKRLSYNHLDIVSGPYGEYWREVRKICVHELLSTQRVQSFKAVRAEEIAVLIDSILSSSSNATPVDVFEMLTGCTQRTICRVAFGSKPGDQLVNDRLTEILYGVMEVSDGFLASDFFPKVGWIIDMITGSHGKIEKCFHKLDSFFQQMIDEHLNPERLKPDNDDIIDVLLKLEKGQRSTIRLTNDHIKAILMHHLKVT